MTKPELQLIKTFKNFLDERLKEYQVIVFGSRARGDADKDSDLDVLVITEEPETYDLFLFVSGCAFEASMAMGATIVINTVVVSRKDWEESPERFSLLALAIRQEGIPV